VNSIKHDSSGASANVCPLDNGVCAPWEVTELLFDCQGHYVDVQQHTGMIIAPPRSVVGQMATLACAGRDNRTSQDSDRSESAPAGSYPASVLPPLTPKQPKGNLNR